MSIEEAEGDSLHLSLGGTGTWRTEGSRIWIEVETVELDDEGVTEEALIEFAKSFARAVADILGIPDEDFPAFEQEAVEEFMAQWEQALSGFSASGTYSLDGDTLVLDLVDGENGEQAIFELYRDRTAVSRTTWAAVKQRF